MTSKTPHLRMGFALTAAALAAGGLIAASTPAPASTASAAVQSAPARDTFVVAYTANMENLVGHNADPAICQRDYASLVRYMAAQPYKPDVFAVQQVSDPQNLDKLVNVMENKLGVDYTGVIAIPDPRPNGGGQCAGSLTAQAPVKMNNDLKANQTNAVIYRTSRFSMRGDKNTWKSNARVGDDQTCRNAAANDPTQDRTINVAVRLYDKSADKNVTVASFHWPGTRVTERNQTNPGGMEDRFACATTNMKELIAESSDSTMGPSALQVYGGDGNVPDIQDGEVAAWYSARGVAGVRDTIAAACGGWAQRTCLSGQWTGSTYHSTRIDYLLADSSSTAPTDGTTVRHNWAKTLTSVTEKYSDHRAVHGNLFY